MRLPLPVLVSCLFAAVVMIAPAAAQAQSKKKPAAYTSVPEAGPDYAYQGEYAGVAFVPGRGNEYAGLQVVALGDGKFDAVRYRGGLPGAGWDGQTKVALNGQISGDGRLVMSAEGQTIAIDSAGRTATFWTASGQPLGRLSKIHRTSPTMGQPAPPGAVVLFDGSTAEHFAGGKLTADGLLQAGALMKMPVHDFRLHIEFRTPFMPTARGQARGNSGVYIQQRYEVQILDSFGLEGVENECGGLYKQQRPDVNMCLPPLAWQTYDIYFTAARFDGEGKKKVSPARITVLHNGVPIHLHREIKAKTGGGKVEGPLELPINLQDHGNPVAFRNIWLVPGHGDWTYGPSYYAGNAGCDVRCCTHRPRRFFLFGRRRCR